MIYINQVLLYMQQFVAAQHSCYQANLMSFNQLHTQTTLAQHLIQILPMRKPIRHTRSAIALLASLVFLPGSEMAVAQSDLPLPVLSMHEFVSEVLATHPGVATREAGRDAGQFRIPQAGALPDPTLGLGIMNLPSGSFSFNQMDMTMKTLSVSQMFPAPGVRDARTSVWSLRCSRRPESGTLALQSRSGASISLNRRSR